MWHCNVWAWWSVLAVFAVPLKGCQCLIISCSVPTLSPTLLSANIRTFVLPLWACESVTSFTVKDQQSHLIHLIITVIWTWKLITSSICVTRSVWIIERSNYAACGPVVEWDFGCLAHALYPSAHPQKPVSDRQRRASPLFSYRHQNMQSANTSEALMCILAFISTKRAWQDFRAPRPATECEEKQLKYAVLFYLDIFTL